MNYRELWSVSRRFGYLLWSLFLEAIFPKTFKTGFLEGLSKSELQQMAASIRVLKADGIPIVPLFNYRHPIIRQMIWELKYKGNRKIANIFAQVIYDELIQIPSPVVLPMPISKERRHERGYNQCELIIDELEKLNALKLFSCDKNILEKWKHTSRQTLNKRSERLQNVQNCFRVKEVGAEHITGKSVVVIDDVVTTGSTLKEVFRVLNRAGVESVRGIVLGH